MLFGDGRQEDFVPRTTYDPAFQQVQQDIENLIAQLEHIAEEERKELEHGDTTIGTNNESVDLA